VAWERVRDALERIEMALTAAARHWAIRYRKISAESAIGAGPMVSAQREAPLPRPGTPVRLPA
jgi:hypothetical protein